MQFETKQKKKTTVTLTLPTLPENEVTRYSNVKSVRARFFFVKLLEPWESSGGSVFFFFALIRVVFYLVKCHPSGTAREMRLICIRN